MKEKALESQEGELEHFEKYQAMAQDVGVGALKRVVLGITSAEEVRKALLNDPSLNSIPLQKWDSCFQQVLGIPAKTRRALSLAEVVCLLKHVARHHVGTP